MMASAIHLTVNTVHPTEAPDLHDRIYMQHLMTNAVHLREASRVLYMIVSRVHLMASAVHPSEAPDVNDGLCSTLDGKSSATVGKCSILKWSS